MQVFIENIEMARDECEACFDDVLYGVKCIKRTAEYRLGDPEILEELVKSDMANCHEAIKDTIRCLKVLEENIEDMADYLEPEIEDNPDVWEAPSLYK